MAQRNAVSAHSLFTLPQSLPPHTRAASASQLRRPPISAETHLPKTTNSIYPSLYITSPHLLPPPSSPLPHPPAPPHSTTMDSDDAASIFDDLSSPSLPLLGPSRPSQHSSLPSSAVVSVPHQPDIDLLHFADPVPDWGRALFHPLPPPHSVHRPPSANELSFHLAWPDPSPPGPHTPTPSSMVPVASVHRDDDEDSVDDTSPPTAEPRRSSPHTAQPEDLGRALEETGARVISKPQPTTQVAVAKAENLEARGNVSHTRRCRAKVNNSFERLLHALPSPPEGVEVKHKAQILGYAIDRFRAVRCHNMRLEMQLALSSPYQMQRWVRSVVTSARSLTEALKPFMALVCLTKKWKYAELWAPHQRPGNPGSTTLKYITGALPPTVEGEELHRLRQYRSNSRKYVFRPRSGVPGRVFLTMRPEWLPLLNDCVAFPRAPHAVRHKVEVTFAVPVIVNGSVQMVVEFFDTKRRDYDPETLNMANEVAVMFGKAFTGQQSAFANATQL